VAPSHVEVALPLPLFRRFTYRVDPGPHGAIPEPGTRVLVPFQRGERIGWVTGPGDPTGIRGIRPVLDILERRPSVPPPLMALARWMAEYYVTPLGLVLRTLVPSVLSDASRDHLILTPAGQAAAGEGSGGLPEARAPGGLSARAGILLHALSGRGGSGTVTALRRQLGRGSPWDAIRELTALGWVEHEMEPPRSPTLRVRKVVRLRFPVPDLARREELFARAVRQRECFELLEGTEGVRELSLLTGEDGFSRSVVAGLEEKGVVEVAEEEILRDPFEGREAPAAPPELTLTPAQRVAVEALVGALARKRPSPFLLHGITGSGKTLVYIHLLREVVERRGRTAIVLVPEIALTPQTVNRFRAWFGEKVAVLHSALSDGERYDEWRLLRSGEKRIVVGARSALFAPLPELGAIVVDEEHDASYKQSEAPRYHARDLAVVRAQREGAVCVLGSATPSLESWRNALEGKFVRLSLPERATGASLPSVEVVDLRTLRKREGKGAGRRPSSLPVWWRQCTPASPGESRGSFS
jgi:primosomal protein N' (replication factor Y) (superfamily II helicase)